MKADVSFVIFLLTLMSSVNNCVLEEQENAS